MAKCKHLDTPLFFKYIFLPTTSFNHSRLSKPTYYAAGRSILKYKGLKMCYSGEAYGLVEQGRWCDVVVSTVEEVASQQGSAEAYGAAGRSGERCSGARSKCVCSPTSHPGSFRCRFHQAEYKWGGRGTGRDQTQIPGL